MKRPGIDLALDPVPRRGRRMALEAALRDAIRTGRLRAGTVLPSSRALAADLGVARGTITGAYEQLIAEGWLMARPGSSTAVAAGPPSVEADASPDGADRPLHDFHPGLPSLDSFPRRAWTAALRRALADRPDHDIGDRSPQGDDQLRVRMVEHLGRARGVVASPEDVVICSGYTQAFTLVAAALRQRGAQAVAVEDPSHPFYRQTLASMGFEVVAVPGDDQGLRLDKVPSHLDAIFVTPAHQFPSGVVLSPERRCQLVAHAAQHGALIFEDDFFGELRYDGPSLAALQALDPDNIAYAGSVSKSLTPGLRLGWLVAPALRRDIVADSQLATGRASALDQIAFSELLASGAFGRHIRRQRARYRERRGHLVAVLQQRVPRLRVHSLAAGLYVLLELPPGASDEKEIVADAASQSIRILAVRDAWCHQPAPDVLAIGFAASPAHAFREAVEELAALLDRHIPR